MREWYLEGKGFDRYRDVSLTLSNVEIRNYGYEFGVDIVRDFITTDTVDMCAYPSRDPACPDIIKERPQPVVVTGCSFRNGHGPITKFMDLSPHKITHNVAYKLWSFQNVYHSKIITGECSGNLAIKGHHTTYRVPTVLLHIANGLFNFQKYAANAKLHGNYAVHADSAGFIMIGNPNAKATTLKDNTASCCKIVGFTTNGGSSPLYMSTATAMGNKVGISIFYQRTPVVMNGVKLADNILGIDFRSKWKPPIDTPPIAPHHFGMGDKERVKVERDVSNLLVLGDLWNDTSISAPRAHAGMIPARGKFHNNVFGRFGAKGSALLKTEGNNPIPIGCFPGEWTNTDFTDEASRQAVKLSYFVPGHGFQTGNSNSGQDTSINVAKGWCGKYRCDYWSRCYVNDMDGTLTAQRSTKQVTLIPALQQWDITWELGCTAKDNNDRQACPWWAKDQPRIMHAATDRKFQGLVRSTSASRGNTVCRAHNHVANGLICDDLNYMDVWVSDLDSRGSNADRHIGPVGITIEGDSKRWKQIDPAKPYSTDIAIGMTETSAPSLGGEGRATQNIFRTVTNSGYFYRLDFSGSLPNVLAFEAPWLRQGQSVVYRVPYATPLKIKLKDSNGKGLIQEQYKKTVVPGKPHGTWYYDPLSNVLSVVISGKEQLMAEVHEVVRISLTCAVPVEQFYKEEGEKFIRNVASVLQVNPERIRIVDVVPGNYQKGRRLSGDKSTSSDVKFDVAAVDKCDEYAKKCLNGGYCVAEGGEPKCRCDKVKFSGEFCQIPDKVEVNTAEIVVTIKEENRPKSGYNLNRSFVRNETNTTTALVTTTVPTKTTPTKKGDGGAYKGDIGQIAVRALEKISSGRFDIGLEVDPSSVKMKLPNISSITKSFNGSLDVPIKYLKPKHICQDGIRTTKEECDDGNGIDGDGCNSTCFMEPGYNCGENYLGEQSVCQDTNECLADDPPACLNNATCTNYNGSFACACLPGYRGTDCGEQIDECKEQKPCSPHATCTDTPGSYQCECKHGYKGNGKDCVEIDECTEFDGSDKGPWCLANGKCIDEVGKARCECPAKVFGHRCETTTDACVARSVKCNHGTCVNGDEKVHKDGYFCECESGWETSNTRLCDQNINECQLNTHKCSAKSTCKDTPGSYECVCDAGYRMQNNDKFTCVEIDECKENKDSCHANAVCTNTPGGYKCDCKPGYSGDGRCVAILNPNPEPDPETLT